ncbi:DUF6939 family protein [Isosphaera pallida]|uniref:DUF6939 family protein n=1 Tax=Isosphaera pallida TaxID=128 RepID=UPI0035CF39E4
MPRHAIVYDVSSDAVLPYHTLSPLWPHGGIPLPGMTDVTATRSRGSARESVWL